MGKVKKKILKDSSVGFLAENTEPLTESDQALLHSFAVIMKKAWQLGNEEERQTLFYGVCSTMQAFYKKPVEQGTITNLYKLYADVSPGLILRVGQRLLAEMDNRGNVEELQERDSLKGFFSWLLREGAGLEIDLDTPIAVQELSEPPVWANKTGSMQ